MRKHEPETSEYIPTPEDSTYQTGSAKPQNEHRGLIAVLMILVTFLGGIASTLGILNIRLLQALNAENKDAEQVAVYLGTVPSTTPSIPEQTEPILPAQNSVELTVEESHSREPISLQDILTQNAPTLTHIQCGSQTATGVILDQAGFLVTNAYAVSDQAPIYVTLQDGSRHRAALVGTDDFTDLAVLYINALGLQAAHLAASDHLQVGDAVEGFHTDGQLMQGQFVRKTDYPIGHENIALLQTDLPLPAGPIYNAFGQIVGFTSPHLSTQTGAVAVPSIIIKDVVEQIICRGAIHGRPCLGADLEELQPMHQQYWQLPQGLWVSRIHDQGNSLSGLLQGDILIRLNSHAIADRESLCAILRTLRPGQEVTATVIRDGVETTLTLTVKQTGHQD